MYTSTINQISNEFLESTIHYEILNFFLIWIKKNTGKLNETVNVM